MSGLVKRVVLCGVAVVLSACAIPTRETDSFLGHARDIPESYSIPGVPFVLQDRNYCGPASLAMVMAYAGRAVSVDQLGNEVFTPGKQGTLQADLIGGARRNGMMALEVRGLSALLHEIAAGHPVVTFGNLGLSWYPKWHYAVVFGYDLAEPSITMHSGSDRALRKSMRKFERAWMDSGYWGLVVLKPGELAATAGELAHSDAAAALEGLGAVHEAELAYAAVLKKWPQSLGSLIGMGNVRFAANASREAVRYLEQAVVFHPDSAVAWHNLAIAQGAAGQQARARASAAKAIALVGAEEASRYRESLHDWLEEPVQ